ncbi:MAG: guanylate kinase [Erysipelotrichales bacterium]|nr:guanylate kinase [Erysipelotrichales bacterium]
MEKRGILIILSGPSGVGKGTVRKEVFKHDDLNLKYSISMTTRAPRVGEIDGIDYYFVSKERFEQAIRDQELLEYAEFVGNYYGTPKAMVENELNKGFNVMLEIEVDGANQVIRNCKDCVTIFLVPPDFQELEQRIRKRKTEEEQVVQKRLFKARQEIELTNNYRHVVVNDDVESTAQRVIDIIRSYQKK